MPEARQNNSKLPDMFARTVPMYRSALSQSGRFFGLDALEWSTRRYVRRRTLACKISAGSGVCRREHGAGRLRGANRQIARQGDRQSSPWVRGRKRCKTIPSQPDQRQ
jgi:hypothetical protein